MLTEKINIIKNNAVYVSGFSDVTNFLKNKLSKNSIIVTMGAGDLYRWHKKLAQFLKTQ